MKLHLLLLLSLLGFALNSYADPATPRHFDGDIMFSVTNGTACPAQVTEALNCVYHNKTIQPNEVQTLLCHPGSKLILSYNPSKLGPKASQLVLARPIGSKATYSFQSFATDKGLAIQYQLINGYKGILVLYGTQSLVVTDAPGSQFYIREDDQYPIPIAISDTTGKKTCN